MKNFAEQQMGAVMDPNRYLNQSLNQITGMGGVKSPHTPELDDVRSAISMARELSRRVISVEAALLGGPVSTNYATEACDLPDGVFVQLQKTSFDARVEISAAQAALDRILASI